MTHSFCSTSFKVLIEVVLSIFWPPKLQENPLGFKLESLVSKNEVSAEISSFELDTGALGVTLVPRWSWIKCWIAFKMEHLSSKLSIPTYNLKNNTLYFTENVYYIIVILLFQFQKRYVKEMIKLYLRNEIMVIEFLVACFMILFLEQVYFLI